MEDQRHDRWPSRGHRAADPRPPPASLRTRCLCFQYIYKNSQDKTARGWVVGAKPGGSVATTGSPRLLEHSHHLGATLSSKAQARACHSRSEGARGTQVDQEPQRPQQQGWAATHSGEAVGSAGPACGHHEALCISGDQGHCDSSPRVSCLASAAGQISGPPRARPGSLMGRRGLARESAPAAFRVPSPE